ncbi:MAG TPA: PIG-L family deacetylase [Terriglobales bacterium]
MPITDREVWPPRNTLRTALGFLALLFTATAFAQAAVTPTAYSLGFLDPLPQDTGATGLKLDLRKLQTTGRLMMVTAHPDDEDGGLLTYEARGKGVQTLLMTLTRGEGGQNKTGDTFSDELGILRTLELLAADRYYGVEQRFSRVADFGYSKTPEETFQKWGGHDVPLADIVRVIRQFRPDVLIARFSGMERDGHGHHQASAILTKEAFRAAADPNRFPEQIKEGLQPWQPKKLYIGNVCGFGASTCPDENYTIKINTGEEDPLLGMTYFQFAIEGLRHQESQGLGDLRFPPGPRYAFYKLEDSVLPKTTDDKGHEKDLFDGIDTSVAGLAAYTHGSAGAKTKEAATQIDAAERATDNSQIARSLISALDSLNGNAGVGKGAPDQQTAFLKVRDKKKQISKAIDLALNVDLRAELTSPIAEASQQSIPAISPGQKFSVELTVHNGSAYGLKLDSLVLDGMVSDRGAAVDDRSNEPAIPAGQDYVHTFKLRLPGTSSPTKPGFHRNDPQRDSVFTVDQPQLGTLPFAAVPPIIARVHYDVPELSGDKSPADSTTANLPEAAAPVVVHVEPSKSVGGKQEIAVVPAFSVAIEPGNQVIPVDTHSPIKVDVNVRSNVDGATGALRLDAPAGWKISPAEANISDLNRGQEKNFEFQVTTSALRQGDLKLHAILQSNGKTYSDGYTLVTRQDLGSFYYFEPATQHESIVDVKTPKDLKVGYIMGAGDDIPAVLQQIGMNVMLISADKIATTDLSPFGTIVLGVRAYDTHKDLVTNNQKLLDFVSNGGTLIVQNNNSIGDFNGEHLTPYQTELSRARVSVEEAPVQILAPDNPVFHYPNEITQKDFDNWVQERGLYFMSSWDSKFTPLLESHDPGEADQKGGMLEAKYGKGTYIFTGYAFFRQLPAGVPGAVRLFVNLVSAGHASQR